MLAYLTGILLMMAPLAADPRGTRSLIEQALDEPARITLENVTLGEALQVISNQTGVRVVIPPAVMRLAPQGEKTLITKVDIANLPLREGLNRLFAPLAMTYIVLDNRIEVVPKPVLRTLARAPTWAELDTLGWLSSLQPGTDSKALDALQKRVQMLVASPTAWETLSNAICKVGSGSGDAVLSAATNSLGWNWTLSEQSVVVGTAEQLIRGRLQRPIFVRMTNRTLFDVTQAVGEAVGVRVQIEPGALAELPSQVQKNFSLDARSKPAEQALDEIAAFTGLGYLIGQDGVLFYRAGDAAPASMAASGSGGPAPGSDPYVAKIIVELGDGKTFEWLIRRSELPSDLQQMRDKEIADTIEALRRDRKMRSKNDIETTGARP